MSYLSPTDASHSHFSLQNNPEAWTHRLGLHYRQLQRCFCMLFLIQLINLRIFKKQTVIANSPAQHLTGSQNVQTCLHHWFFWPLTHQLTSSPINFGWAWATWATWGPIGRSRCLWTWGLWQGPGDAACDLVCCWNERDQWPFGEH